MDDPSIKKGPWFTFSDKPLDRFWVTKVSKLYTVTSIMSVTTVLAVSQCVIPEHQSPLTLKIIPDWARKIYLSETGLTGSDSQLDRTKRTAFPCIAHHRQIRAVHNHTLGPSGREDIGTYGVTSALNFSLFFFLLLLSTEYYSRSQHKPTIEPSVFFACPVRLDSAQHTGSKIRPWLGPVLSYQLLKMTVIHR